MFKFWKELYYELRIWRRLSKVAKGSRETLGEKNFRVDWVGRIYTVINLPEEMLSRPDLQEGWVFMQLREYDTLFMDLGIADYLFPEITPIPDRGAYLLVLTGPKDYIGVRKILWNIFKLIILCIILRILYSVGAHYWENIVGAWNNLMTIF
jgi:hypothetical protein|tara:strand:- start:307 stop:762 length:456 start_codon:yes stop_codon:yes gene_type:complete